MCYYFWCTSPSLSKKYSAQKLCGIDMPYTFGLKDIGKKTAIAIFICEIYKDMTKYRNDY